MAKLEEEPEEEEEERNVYEPTAQEDDFRLARLRTRKKGLFTI